MTAAEDEVVELASQLIAIDTTNTGEPDGTVGEREAAEDVAGKLSEVGYEVEVLDLGAPGRSNVFCRLPGADRERGPLLVPGHLDGVPARPAGGRGRGRPSGRCTRAPERCRTATGGAAGRSP